MSDGSFIKIGYTSRDIHKRIKELSTGSSSKIYLLNYIKDATFEDEQKLHKQFGYAKKNREWYYASPLLLDYINDNSDMMTEVENIDGKIYVYKKMKII